MKTISWTFRGLTIIIVHDIGPIRLRKVHFKTVLNLLRPELKTLQNTTITSLGYYLTSEFAC